MSLLKDYGLPGVIGLVAALLITWWVDAPSNAQRLVILAVSFLVVTALAQVVARMFKRGGGTADTDSDEDQQAR